MRISVALLLSGLAGWPANAQTLAVGSGTQVRTVSFSVAGEAVVGEDELLERIATRGRGGMIGVRRALSSVHVAGAVEERLFDPEELQRDKERLRRFFALTGYPHAAVDYEVLLDEEADVVDIVFLVRPGVPLVVRWLSVVWDGPVGTPELDPSDALADLLPRIEVREGEPLDERAIPPAAVGLGRWLGERGYPFASVRPEVSVDSAASEARVVLWAAPGPRARLGRIEVSGNDNLSAGFIRDFLDVESGEWFSPHRLQSASQRLATLDLIASASFEVPPDQRVDTLVNVVLRVREEIPRSVGGQLGYATDGGFGGEAQWTHRSIFGGAQALTASLSGQSGVLALSENYERFIRGSLTFRQPIRGSTRLTVHAGPFAEYRDDYRDRSVQLGIETTLVYQIAPLSSIALRHELATRRIFQYRFGDVSGGLDLLELLQLGAQGILDRFGARINTSVLSLSGSFGSLDAPTEPRRGFVVLPSLAVTFPGGLTSVEYVTGNVRASGYLPLSETITLGARVGAGKLIPIGKSVPPSPDEGLRAYFQLRDVLFTAGGTNDVRGWDNRMLGPKFPQIFIKAEDDSTVTVSADQFAPIGGFNRLHGTVELRLPLPPLGAAWGSRVFADAGRIWTKDERFTSNDDPLGVEKLFWSVGLGVDYETIIGALWIALGYKMNPSVFDLADPGEVTQAIIEGTPIHEVPRQNWRRFHIHFGIGTRL